MELDFIDIEYSFYKLNEIRFDRMEEHDFFRGIKPTIYSKTIDILINFFIVIVLNYQLSSAPTISTKIALIVYSCFSNFLARKA